MACGWSRLRRARERAPAPRRPAARARSRPPAGRRSGRREAVAQPAGQVGVVLRLEREAAERIASHGVEARAHQHEVGHPAGRGRHDRRPEVVDVARRRAPGPRGTLNTLPTPRSSAIPVPGIPGVLMQRDVAHGRIVLDQRLGAVAVVDIPVDDQHALPAGALGVPRRRPRRSTPGRTPSPARRAHGGPAAAPPRRRARARPARGSRAAWTAPVAPSAASQLDALSTVSRKIAPPPRALIAREAVEVRPGWTASRSSIEPAGRGADLDRRGRRGRARAGRGAAPGSRDDRGRGRAGGSRGGRRRERARGTSSPALSARGAGASGARSARRWAPGPHPPACATRPAARRRGT